jgi:hypothetical protein
MTGRSESSSRAAGRWPPRRSRRLRRGRKRSSHPSGRAARARVPCGARGLNQYFGRPCGSEARTFPTSSPERASGPAAQSVCRRASLPGRPDIPRARLTRIVETTDLAVAETVEAEGEHATGDRDLGDLASTPLDDALERDAERAAALNGFLGGLDQGPTWEGPACQGRRSCGSRWGEDLHASVVALPYMGARGGGAGGRMGAAAAHSRPGQRGRVRRAGRFVGARRMLFRRWGRCSHGVAQAACSSSARTWWARRAILRATVRAARLLPLRCLPAR